MAWSRTSRHARGYGTAWDKLRKAKLTDQPLCEYCLPSRITAATEVDHKTPKAKGGTDDWDNLASTCHTCHVDKTTRENGGKVKQQIGPDGWPA